MVVALHQFLTFACGEVTLPLTTTVDPLASTMRLTGTLYLKVLCLGVAAIAVAGSAATATARTAAERPTKRPRGRRNDREFVLSELFMGVPFSQGCVDCCAP